jgi:hypothetical protein
MSTQINYAYKRHNTWVYRRTVITPPAMVIGSYIVLSQKLDRLLGRSSVRGITG